jgi:beta-glucosidase
MPACPLEQRVPDLLGRMTLEEKIDQLHQCGAGDTNPNNLPLLADQFRPTYGSFILNGAQPDLALRNALQRQVCRGIAAGDSRDLRGRRHPRLPDDLPDSARAGLLVESGTGAPGLRRRRGGGPGPGRGLDLCADGRHRGGCPLGAHCRDLWRVPLCAASIYCEAAVRGYQGLGAGTPPALAACLKHFAGYGNSEGGRDYSYTDISPQRLWEMHLPPFAAGVKGRRAHGHERLQRPERRAGQRQPPPADGDSPQSVGV